MGSPGASPEPVPGEPVPGEPVPGEPVPGEPVVTAPGEPVVTTPVAPLQHPAAVSSAPRATLAESGSDFPVGLAFAGAVLAVLGIGMLRLRRRA